MSEEAKLPRWLKPANRAIVALQRLGLVIGTMHLFSVPGRKSGQLRTTPVSPMTVDGRRSIVAGLEEADWAKNARAAGWGILSRGRKHERVTLRAADRGARPHPTGVSKQGAGRGSVLPATVRRVERAGGVRGAGAALSGVPGRGGERMI